MADSPADEWDDSESASSENDEDLPGLGRQQQQEQQHDHEQPPQQQAAPMDQAPYDPPQADGTHNVEEEEEKEEEEQEEEAEASQTCLSSRDNIIKIL